MLCTVSPSAPISVLRQLCKRCDQYTSPLPFRVAVGTYNVNGGKHFRSLAYKHLSLDDWLLDCQKNTLQSCETQASLSWCVSLYVVLPKSCSRPLPGAVDNMLIWKQLKQVVGFESVEWNWKCVVDSFGGHHSRGRGSPSRPRAWCLCHRLWRNCRLECHKHCAEHAVVWECCLMGKRASKGKGYISFGWLNKIFIYSCFLFILFSKWWFQLKSFQLL